MQTAAKEAKTGEITKLAVFDFDGTTISGQSGALFSQYLFAHGYLSKKAAAKLMWWGVRYKLHLPYNQDEPREAIFMDLKCLDPRQISSIMRNFHGEKLVPRYKKQAIDEIKKRKAEGCHVLLVSATFHEIAEAAGEYMGVDDVIATHMQVDDMGRFTGKVDGIAIEGEAKPQAVRKWANSKYGNGKWELTYAYGDHHSDEELLSAAKHSFPVCPGETLKRIAKKNNWTILEWGK